MYKRQGCHSFSKGRLHSTWGLWFTKLLLFLRSSFFFFYGGSTTVFRQTNCVCLTANFEWISMSLEWIGIKQSRQSDLLFCFPSADCKLLLNSRTLCFRHPSFPVVLLTSLCNEARIVNRGQIAAKRRDDEPRGIISVVKKQRATLRPTVVSP